MKGTTPATAMTLTRNHDGQRAIVIPYKYGSRVAQLVERTQQSGYNTKWHPTKKGADCGECSCGFESFHGNKEV